MDHCINWKTVPFWSRLASGLMILIELQISNVVDEIARHPLVMIAQEMSSLVDSPLALLSYFI